MDDAQRRTKAGHNSSPWARWCELKTGVDDTTFLALRAMYKGSVSQVRYQDQLSERLTVQQETNKKGKARL